MEADEGTTCSLIVKVWVEEVDEQSGSPLWRGRVTHVMNGQQHYFADLTTFMRIIRHYLGELGITPEPVDLPPP